MDLLCILGNQLFEPKYLPLPAKKTTWVFMREDRELCTHFKYHKHKIVFFLSAMRKYAAELRDAGYQVHYETLGAREGLFEERLLDFTKERKVHTVHMFEIEDKFFESRIQASLAHAGIDLVLAESPMFLTSRPEFSKYLKGTKKPFMKTFYEQQRKRLKILVERDGKPVGGKWSFDDENRQPLPKDHDCPPIPAFKPDDTDREVCALVDREFPDHPGATKDFWLPTDRDSANRWAKDFFEKRFEHFGPYEDAISKTEPFVYHSVLTPYLNTGLVVPKDCVAAAVRYQKAKNIPMNSCEGFVRQVIGWREFIRGIYQNFSAEQDKANFFGHKKRLTAAWYDATTGIEPLDDVIRGVITRGYAHHIERLMIVGSLMVLLEVDPREGHRWFMEMFIDSSDWVMGPNVYGMALFSDGGIFATKPYICGSNYYKKMAGYKNGSWCDGVDGLYWQFIAKHRDRFAANHRMSMMVRGLGKISPERMALIGEAAQKLRNKLVTD